MTQKKTEFDRMLAGELYEPGLDGLRESMVKGQLLMHEYNQLKTTDSKRKQEILTEMLKEKGESVVFRPPFYVDFGSNITIGDRFFANYHCTILDTAPITIGDDVMFGPNVSLIAPEHPLHPDYRVNGLESGRPITIGDRVWIGGSVTIVGGVTIGEGSVVAAGSIVTKDVPPMTIVAGTPAKVIRKITEEDRQRDAQLERQYKEDRGL